MFEISIGGEQIEIENRGSCGNPKVIFAHVSGRIFKWPTFELSLTKCVNFCIPTYDFLNVDISYDKILAEQFNLYEPFFAPIVLQTKRM